MNKDYKQRSRQSFLLLFKCSTLGTLRPKLPCSLTGVLLLPVAPNISPPITSHSQIGKGLSQESQEWEAPKGSYDLS